MGLRETLLAASMGATMVAGTNSEAHEDVARPITPAQTRSMSQAEIQEMNFQKNYRYLYNTVSGAWFSFGDEKKMRQALYDIGSFPMGRKVIAGIPENMDFGSTNFISNKQGGNFRLLDNSLNINTSYVDKQVYDKRGTIMTLRDTLFHELLHAYQKKQGIALVDEYPSVDEILHAQKLIEAETAAWNSVLKTTADISSDNSYFLRPQEVQDLMHRDLVVEERKRMQQALIACRGNCDLAQKKMVGHKIKQMMNETNSDWSKSYNEQALCVAATLCLNKKITKHGNPAAYQKMLNYYKKNYDLNPRDISNTQLTTEHADTIAHIKTESNKHNLYTNPIYSPSSNIAQRHGGGR